MSSHHIRRAMVGLYLVLFFAYLFGPLIIMSVTAFNTSAYPAVMPFEGFTLEWFRILFNDKDMTIGLQNSLKIGVLVVLISVPCGLAGAMLMQQVYARARSFYYLVVVSPVLTPGVIIGISTIIFWKDFTATTGISFIYDGIILAALGQSTFISAYCMLIFLSRLQRFDAALEEAGLDLGASHGQVFWHILIPYLRPAILSAAVMAFLSSFENYNTTTFAILADKTLTTVLAGRVRQGSTPAISALAVTIIAITVAGTIIYELVKRREDARKAAVMRTAQDAERREMAAA